MSHRAGRARLSLLAAALVAATAAAAGAGPAAAPSGCAAPPGRAVRVAEPASPPTALLVALHGYGSSGARLAAASGIEARGNAAGARVVVPDGTGSPARWALTGRLAGSDDLAFVAGLIDRCAAGATTVVAGFSNGAAFAAELACALGPRVDAVLLVGGAGLAAPCDGGERGAPAARTVAVHGGADAVVPIEGGPVLGGSLTAGPLEDAPADEVVVVPGWGHTWPPAATEAAIELVGAYLP